MSCEKNLTKFTKDSITNTQKKTYKTKRSLSTREEVKQHNRNRKRTKPLWTVYLVAYTSFALFACIIEYKNDITNAMSWISRRRKKWKKITNASSLFPWYFLNRFACDVPKTRDRFFLLFCFVNFKFNWNQVIIDLKQPDDSQGTDHENVECIAWSRAKGDKSPEWTIIIIIIVG